MQAVAVSLSPRLDHEPSEVLQQVRNAEMYTLPQQVLLAGIVAPSNKLIH